jgi:hypothetical protein
MSSCHLRQQDDVETPYRKDCSQAKILNLTLYKAHIRVMAYASPTWHYAADAHQVKLQLLQNKVLRDTENLDRFTLALKLHLA